MPLDTRVVKPAVKLAVGGQAVVEGVMMRSPNCLAVVCRRPDGSVVIRENQYHPLWADLKFPRWPLIRGSIMLLESLFNGISALTFSASQQRAHSLGARSTNQPEQAAQTPTYGMVALSLVFAIALFVGAPHLAAWGLGNLLGFDASDPSFHAVDGFLKLAILIAYMSAISLMDDVRRVFQYHGAEHKAIFTYEAGLALTIDNARKQSRFHPRCGTSFLLIVIMVSVLLFALALSFPVAESAAWDHLLKILIKIPLMLPVAGIAYELLRLAGKHCETSLLARLMSAPGMWLQKITTKDPEDGQLEIALISIRKTLWREKQTDDALREGASTFEVFASADDVDLPLVA